MSTNLQPIVEQFNRLDIKARYAIFTMVLLGVVALDYFFLIRMQLDGLAGMDKEIQTVSVDTERVKTDIQRMGQIKQGVDSTKSQLEALNKKVRSIEEVPIILEDISRIAQEFHVEIEQITPLKEAQEILSTGPDAQYSALPIVIKARSGYHMFGRFLNKLENNNLLFMVKDLRMEDNGKGNGLVIQTTLKVVLVDHSPPPPQAPAKGAAPAKKAPVKKK